MYSNAFISRSWLNNEGRLMFYSNVIYISRFRTVNKSNEILLKVVLEKEERVWFAHLSPVLYPRDATWICEVRICFFPFSLSCSVYIFHPFVTLTYVAARIPRMRVYLFSCANDAYATKNAIAFSFSPPWSRVKNILCCHAGVIKIRDPGKNWKKFSEKLLKSLYIFLY